MRTFPPRASSSTTSRHQAGIWFVEINRRINFRRYQSRVSVAKGIIHKLCHMTYGWEGGGGESGLCYDKLIFAVFGRDFAMPNSDEREGWVRENSLPYDIICGWSQRQTKEWHGESGSFTIVVKMPWEFYPTKSPENTLSPSPQRRIYEKRSLSKIVNSHLWSV